MMVKSSINDGNHKDYPLVVTNIAIEHGHRNSGCSHEKNGDLPPKKNQERTIGMRSHMGLSENVGYIPNEIAIFHRDNDQQNHWVQWGTLFSDTIGLVFTGKI